MWGPPVLAGAGGVGDEEQALIAANISAKTGIDRRGPMEGFMRASHFWRCWTTSTLTQTILLWLHCMAEM